MLLIAGVLGAVAGVLIVLLAGGSGGAAFVALTSGAVIGLIVVTVLQRAGAFRRWEPDAP